MDKRPQYVMCPRCELNYIESTEKLCNVCKAELGLVDIVLIKDDLIEEVDGKLCPVCKTNFCEDGEDKCIMCLKEKPISKNIEEPENWEDNVSPEDIEQEPIEISLTQLEEEESECEIEEETPADEFEYVSPDEDDYDDEDDDEDEDDDMF